MINDMSCGKAVIISLIARSKLKTVDIVKKQCMMNW